MDIVNQYMAGPVGGIVAVVIGLFVLLLAVLWFCLPFAVFGIKPLLREVLAQQRITNEYLQDLAAGGKATPGRPGRVVVSRVATDARAGEPHL